MKMDLASRLYRFFKFLRTGFSMFLAFPLQVANFLMLAYGVIMLDIPIGLFFIGGLCVFIPLGAALGLFFMRKSGIFATEMVLSTESNKQVVHIQRVMMDMQDQFYREQGMKFPPKWNKLRDYWRRLDDENGWKP